MRPTFGREYIEDVFQRIGDGLLPHLWATYARPGSSRWRHSPSCGVVRSRLRGGKAAVWSGNAASFDLVVDATKMLAATLR